MRRSKIEKIEDGFADLSLEDQAKLLVSLSKLHRWCKRERERNEKEAGS
jgi:hypothetical protein